MGACCALTPGHQQPVAFAGTQRGTSGKPLTVLEGAGMELKEAGMSFVASIMHYLGAHCHSQSSSASVKDSSYRQEQ